MKTFKVIGRLLRTRWSSWILNEPSAPICVKSMSRLLPTSGGKVHCANSTRSIWAATKTNDSNVKTGISWRDRLLHPFGLSDSKWCIGKKFKEVYVTNITEISKFKLKKISLFRIHFVLNFIYIFNVVLFGSSNGVNVCEIAAAYLLHCPAHVYLNVDDIFLVFLCCLLCAHAKC